MFDPTLFRPQAIRYYLDREREGAPVPLRIAPAWTWWAFWVLGGSMVMALLLSVVLRVEVQGTGRGVFHLASGSRPLVVQATGKVVRVASRGKAVAKGDLLLELESPALQAELLEADRALARIEQVARPSQAGLERLVELQIQKALLRMDAQKEQLASQMQSAILFERKLATVEKLGSYGLVSGMSVDDAREALSQAQRSVNSVRQALMASEQEVASLRARKAGDNLRDHQEAWTVRARREALAFSLSQTRILAPEAGVIDGLHVQVGDMLSTGQNVGRLLTGGGSLKAFALLAERDGAQVRPGDTVRLEVDQYPFSDWGVLLATIQRVGESPAAVAEMREIFGEQLKIEGPAYLVELAIPSGQNRPVAKQSFQSGMSFRARFVLRRQRPISLLFEPLRRWVE